MTETELMAAMDEEREQAERAALDAEAADEARDEALRWAWEMSAAGQAEQRARGGSPAGKDGTDGCLYCLRQGRFQAR